MTLLDDKLSIVAGISYDWFDVRKAEEDPDNDGNLIEPGTPGAIDTVNPMLGLT